MRARLMLTAMLVAALLGCGGVVPPTRTPTPQPYVGPDVAAMRVGRDLHVRMKIECIDSGGRVRPTYLRSTCYYEGFFFRLAIPPDALEAFVREMGGTPEALLLDEVVDASGVVQQNGSWAEIVLTRPNQLRVARAWREVGVPTRVPTIPPTVTPPG